MNPTYENAISFYKRNYRAVYAYPKPGEEDRRIVLGTAAKQRCRFCGGQSPEVSFRLEAHAIPESIGNKTLFTRYECDACNSFFGSSIENDFGHWSKPMRTLTGRRGKKGVPTLKGGGTTGWRIERENNHFSIMAGEDETSRPFVASEDDRTLTFDLPCDPHVPMGVLKAFVKMGLSIMPEEELPHFRKTLAWLRNPVHQEDVPILAPVRVTFTPGSALDGFTIGVLCRKPDAPDPVPYAFLLLSYGNESFQVIVPSPEQDAAFESEESIRLMPFPWSPSSDGSRSTYDVDLRDTELIRDARMQSTFEFESVATSEPDRADTQE